MSSYRLVYISVFILAVIFGIFSKKYHTGLKVLVGLLILGITTEFWVEANKILQLTSEAFIYNIYIPLEYLCYSYFFYKMNKSRKMRKAVILSIPLFVISIPIFSSFMDLPVHELLTEIYTLSGILVILWSIWTLFTIKPEEGLKFHTHPLFWICTGLIIFYSGITPFNLMHNHLKNNNAALFEFMSRIIQKGLNVFLYTSFIIGFICSHRMKK